MDKKKYDIKIAGVELSILSDEREEFVQRLVASLDEDISAVISQNKRCSTLDAVILTALDSKSERLKSEKRIRNLEAQIALYDANLRRMREENIKLKSALLGKQDADFAIAADNGDAAAEKDEASEDEISDKRQLTITAEADTAEETVEEPVEAAAEPETVPAEKGDKLRQIESLLRGKGF